ncbi:MAG: hypothetical protein M1820_001482 [Bogoriella megaspora]|nr:MAG: hypothetical protein M1820_001482 [Bogoriella megaspora]
MSIDLRSPGYSQTYPNFDGSTGYSDLLLRTNKWKQAGSRKYLLWPQPSKSPPIPEDEPAPNERDMALSVLRSATSLSDNAMTRDSSNATEVPLGLRPKAGSFSRRRRPGVTELGPMATVQESVVDSPTIPGRPPVPGLSKYSSQPSQGHGRSSSAPGGGWRNNPFGDAILSCVTEPPTIAARSSAQAQSTSGSPNRKKMPNAVLFKSTPLEPIFSPANPGRESRPILTIRTNTESIGSPEDKPPPPPPKSAPISNIKSSPASRRPNVLRKNSATTLNRTLSIAQTPLERSSAESLSSKASDSKVSSPETTNTPATAITPATAVSASPSVHKRQPSEVSVFDGSPSADGSVVNRGRPMKRTKSFSHERTPSVSSASVTSSELKEVWKLPAGLKKPQAIEKLTSADQQKLQRQAASQALKFEVLSERDVSTLSKELRALDERCDYLRKTYRSLRAGRQKLHARMMSYLKREEGAIFTRDGLIRQEEALAELDSSLDDWISKIEQAENRRLRVRQKLLEHFCVAVTLGHSEGGCGSPSNGISQIAMLVSPGAVPGPSMPPPLHQTTPPRSPVERSLAESPKLESALSAAPPADDRTYEPESPRLEGGRRDVQSIKIYADGNVLDLFSDIETAIDNMFIDYDDRRAAPKTTSLADDHVVVAPTMDDNDKPSML